MTRVQLQRLELGTLIAGIWLLALALAAALGAVVWDRPLLWIAAPVLALLATGAFVLSEGAASALRAMGTAP